MPGESLLGEGLSDHGAAALRAAMARRGRAATAPTLRLPEGALLERRVTLPLMAERAPRQVLDYEMDRLTPFPSSDLAWTWAVEARDPARGEIRLRLSFVTRAALAPVLGALERAGVVPARLEARASGQRRSIDLRPAAAGPARAERWLLALAGGACAILAVAAAAQPFVWQAAARDAVEARFAALAPGVARAGTIRRELAARAAGADLFTAEQARVGDPMALIGVLTELLPDDTFLTELTLRERKLGLTGQSGAAARLIALLAANRAIGDPVFSAPVTRADNGRGDLFSIQARMAP